MGLAVDTIEGPAFLAPSLINGDDSSMSDADMHVLDLFLSTIPSGCYVVSCTDDEYLGKWHGGWCTLYTYVLHRMC